MGARSCGPLTFSLSSSRRRWVSTLVDPSRSRTRLVVVDGCPLLWAPHVVPVVLSSSMGARVVLIFSSSIGAHKSTYYDLDDWPAHSEGARNALDDMKSTHRAVPLAAYDVHDHLIPPTSYRQQLQGALVEIHFDLSYSAFKGKDTFTADIHSICVITVPPSTATAKKRPLPATFAPPTNRPRIV
ncbi:hypothetical protein BU15DRAFT_76109 [Melanogaster broomeanus]|nr:hypothetical protein BU15DRAFT_76109 [Melanogaster broomeanus]